MSNIANISFLQRAYFVGMLIGIISSSINIIYLEYSLLTFLIKFAVYIVLYLSGFYLLKKFLKVEE